FGVLLVGDHHGGGYGKDHLGLVLQGGLEDPRNLRGGVLKGDGPKAHIGVGVAAVALAEGEQVDGVVVPRAHADVPEIPLGLLVVHGAGVGDGGGVAGGARGQANPLHVGRIGAAGAAVGIVVLVAEG